MTTLDQDAINAIEQILKNGNKAVIQRSPKGIIVMEEKRKIKHTIPSRG